MIDKAYTASMEVLDKCATPYGFFAANPGYDMVFARDSMIILLGATLVGERYKQTCKRSLITLAKYQLPSGQIPNAVDMFSKRERKVDYQSIDSTLWFIIGHYTYKERFKDNSLFRQHSSVLEKAAVWLFYQDISNDLMLEQLPTTDWQDAFPHKYGHCLNTQTLYYQVLKLRGENSKTRLLQENVLYNPSTSLWDKDYFLPYRWKNHGPYQEKGDWFDTLGNLLAIVYDLADDRQSRKILNYIINKKINHPYPVKAIYPPIYPSSEYWQEYYRECEAKKPHHYLNGGIWTYIGGFYVLALLKLGREREAYFELSKLAQANLFSGFAEWLDGKTGKYYAGKNQGWNAALYIIAHNSLKAREVLL